MSNGRLSFVVPTYRLREVGEMVARNYLRGELARDAAMDPHTNVTQGLTRENSLVLQAGEVPDDAIDYVEMALDDEGQTRLEDLNDVYVLVNFRPAVTEQNWHIDCGVTTCATRSRWSSSMRRLQPAEPWEAGLRIARRRACRTQWQVSRHGSGAVASFGERGAQGGTGHAAGRRMELISLALVFGFFALSWGLTHFCDRLQDDGRK